MTSRPTSLQPLPPPIFHTGGFMCSSDCDPEHPGYLQNGVFQWVVCVPWKGLMLRDASCCIRLKHLALECYEAIALDPSLHILSLRLEQVKELVTAVAMAAPTVISMVSTPPRATNQAAREHLVGSSQALVNSRSLRMFIQSIAGCHPSLPIPFAVQNPGCISSSTGVWLAICFWYLQILKYSFSRYSGRIGFRQHLIECLMIPSVQVGC